ncbi:MAG: chemotaxis protein CheW [Cellvibrionaceae bacterium]
MTNTPEETLFEENAESVTARRWQQLRCYGFSTGPHQLLVPQGTYCELLTQYRLARFPNAPAHLLGLTNVRGNLIPVYQLEPLLALASERTPYALIIGNLPDAAALAIAHKPVQLDLAELTSSDDVRDFPGLLQSAVTATYVDSNGSWSTFDHEQLFSMLASVH